MKRIVLLLIIPLIMLLFGCAMKEEQPFDDDIDVSINDQVYYSYSTLSFMNTSSYDIFYNTGNASDDFLILLDELSEKASLSTEEIDAYIALFEKVDEISSKTNDLPGDLLYLSLADFKTIAERYDIEVTLSDIFTYNSVASMINDLQVANNNKNVFMSKIEYVETRLGRNLTPSEIEDLRFLQESIVSLAYDYIHINVSILSLSELLSEFEQYYGELPTNDIDSITVAYNIVSELKE